MCGLGLGLGCQLDFHPLLEEGKTAACPPLDFWVGEAGHGDRIARPIFSSFHFMSLHTQTSQQEFIWQARFFWFVGDVPQIFYCWEKLMPIAPQSSGVHRRRHVERTSKRPSFLPEKGKIQSKTQVVLFLEILTNQRKKCYSTEKKLDEIYVCSFPSP